MLNIKQLSQSHAKTCPFCRDGFQPNKQLFACQECNALIHKECWSEHPSCMTCQTTLITRVKLNKHGELTISKTKKSRKQKKRHAKKNKARASTIRTAAAPSIVQNREVRIARPFEERVQTQLAPNAESNGRDSTQEVKPPKRNIDSTAFEFFKYACMWLLAGCVCIVFSALAHWLLVTHPDDQSAIALFLGFLGFLALIFTVFGFIMSALLFIIRYLSIASSFLVSQRLHDNEYSRPDYPNNPFPL